MRETEEELSAAVEALLGNVSGPLDWRAVRTRNAAAEWAALRGWVLPPCWYRHPALVDVLTALRDHQRGAFDPMQPLSAATEWQRVFRDLEPRLRDWASRTRCSNSAHRDELAIDWPDDQDTWTAHLDNDVQARQRRETAATPTDGRHPDRDELAGR
jgi:hypothetical protein